MNSKVHVMIYVFRDALQQLMYLSQEVTWQGFWTEVNFVLKVTLISLLVYLSWIRPSAFSDSELISESMNHCRYFGWIPLTRNLPIVRSVPKQDSTTYKNNGTRPCLERDLNPRFQCLSFLRPCRLKPRGRWDRPFILLSG